MKTYIDCIPCFFRQALDAARLCTEDDFTHKRVLDELGGMIRNIPMEKSPPEFAQKMYEMINKVTNNADPFKDMKKKYNQLAMDLYPELKERVRQSDDPLLTAVRVAIAGNIIDFATGMRFDLHDEVAEAMHIDFSINHIEHLRDLISKADNILYLGDNCGETAFDRVLLETIDRDITYAVRDIPIINDATMEDALYCGIDKCSNLISSGSQAPGTVVELCSDEFKELYNEADLIISKGQGNFETMSDNEGNIVFLLRAKCKVIAKKLECNVGDIICKYNKV